tara:strand:- start:119225 stop:119473 length:249 start_codon:yes stop_codon:yes gene_type:complete
MAELTRTDFQKAKEICKAHGVKGFRKLALKRPLYIAGKQCIKIENAQKLLIDLHSAGYGIRDYQTCFELAQKGMLDCVTISL